MTGASGAAVPRAIADAGRFVARPPTSRAGTNRKRRCPAPVFPVIRWHVATPGHRSDPSGSLSESLSLLTAL
jgi:hypothetical protein